LEFGWQERGTPRAVSDVIDVYFRNQRIFTSTTSDEPELAAYDSAGVTVARSGKRAEFGEFTSERVKSV
jgi:hypothetical protein